ncbi:MptD family putative ECF transporter S component [Actinomyces slackii]|uniref:Conserved hypothetical integral membrane protein n=1 Tax=Actinomyces slackii TaxID=52774 RepID=A0A3S4U3K4_9ACTO|nr:MptD family putative ECF transporter S component [Actinomyces slackii]VEG75667.1 conserved hypothetical integral membrane protein [Actinomyces slackii]
MEPTASAASRGISAPRHLITVGVFTALYFVFFFAGGMLGIFHPAMMLIGGVVTVVLNGIVCMLMVAKTRAMWAYTIMGVVVGLLMVGTGHYWATVLVAAALGVVADLITRAGGYRRATANALGYALFSLWGIAPILPIFLNSQAYLADIEAQMGAQYAGTFAAVFSAPVVAAWGLMTLALAYGSALVGMRILHRHFERAGVA